MKKKSIFLISSMFALSCFSSMIVSCNKNNNHIIQSEDRNIVSIEPKEDTIPEEIFIGKFDQAGIKLIVNYSDETIEEVSVTTEMVPENQREYLTKPGIYTIQLLFKGSTVSLTIKMVMPHYAVNFYAYTTSAEYTLVDSQDLMEHSLVEAPEVEQDLYFDGWHYSFTGWDKEFYDLTEPLDIYALYSATEYYEVTFYNGNDIAISTQKIDKGADAIEPSEEERLVSGYEFIGWDRSYLNVQKTISVNGLYTKVTQVGTVESPYIYQDDEITEQFYSLYLTDNGKGYGINSLISTQSEMIVPSTYKGLPIIELGERLFNNRTEVEKIEIGYNIKRIRPGCFADNDSLKNLSIPNSVELMDGWVSDHCSSLKFNIYERCKYLGNKYNPYLYLFSVVSKYDETINIKNGCKFIGDGGFQGSRVRRLIIPDSVVGVYNSCLSYCNELEYVKFSDRMDTIDWSVLYQSGAQKKTVVLPKNLSCIRSGAFYGANVVDIVLPDSLKVIERDGLAINIYLESIVLNEGLERIEENAFAHNHALKSVNIPKSLKEFASHAFYDCESLTDITFNGTVQEWNAKFFPYDCFAEVGATQITCSDGTIPL